MSVENETTMIICDTEPLYQGWEEYYREESGERTAWGDKAPPFLSKLLGKYLSHEANVVDFGAGDARNSLKIGKTNGLTLVDISPAGLERARRKAVQLGLRPMPILISASLELLPLASDQFEFGLCIDALPQVYRPQQALKEMARTLVPGGHLIVNVFTPSDCAYGEGERVSGRSFLYKNTMFNFFEEAEFLPLLVGLFEVVESLHVTWQDPPHHPFRPYEHTHDALVYVLRKP